MPPLQQPPQRYDRLEREKIYNSALLLRDNLLSDDVQRWMCCGEGLKVYSTY